MNNEKGFTLIELLVVIAIIGILAAIAIPQFAEYKVRAFNSRAQSDLRNGLTAEEAYFVDNEVYLDCSDTDCTGSLPGYVLSSSTSVAFNAFNGSLGTNTEFGGQTCNSKGDRNYTWTSSSSVMTNAGNSSCSPTAPTS